MPGTVFALLVALAVPLVSDGMQDHLRQHGQPPADDLLAKLGDHRIVIVGENHFQRGDPLLIAGIVPELRRRNVTLAMEVLLASSQADIDALIAAPEWNQALAISILRAADWPYLEYRDILHRAWEANRAAPGTPPLKLVALGPPADWRAQGIRYDAFMADRVRSALPDERRRVLVYCGLHHGFTHYLQAERVLNGRITEFMDRMGNILWRQFGQEVFLIALHKPWACGDGDNAFATYCAPLGGAIDCAALKNGGSAVGFDILGSPIAEAKLGPKTFYAGGHPLLRMADFVDGYVWQAPVEEIEMVHLIPLDEFVVTEDGRAAKRAKWQREADDLAAPKNRASWGSLPEWRASCGLAVE